MRTISSAPSSLTSDAQIPVDDDAVQHAMFTDQVARARGFAAIAMAMIVLVGVQLPWLEDATGRRTPAAIALVVMFLIAGWTFYRTRSEATFTKHVFRVFGWGLSTAILAVEHYAGFFSPITVVLSLGIYFLGQSTDRVNALLLSFYVTLGWLTGAVLVAAGLVADAGLYTSSHIDTRTKVLMISGVGGCMIATTWLATLARRSIYSAIVEAHRAAVSARKRDALLLEAQQQLDRAMELVAHKAGAHSGRRAGSYTLGDVIGVGAMGEVYSARNDQGEYAAVKLLHRETMERPDHIVRFLREASLCLRFDHPNVIKVYEVGRMDDGAPYMAMARLEGVTLSAVLRKRGHLRMTEVLELARAVCAGLSHAHACGVVHRDLKPHNILWSHEPDGSRRWTILDFGISKPMDSEGTLTGEAGVLGTPAYMSPEQARGLAVDQRSDVFSLCSVLYRALTGRPAFPGRDTPGIMFDVAYRMPDQPSLQVAGILPDVDLVLAVGLAKDPAQRFESPEAVHNALELAARGALDEALRKQARALLERQPWGSHP